MDIINFGILDLDGAVFILGLTRKRQDTAHILP